MKKSKASYISMRRGEKIAGVIWLVCQIFSSYLANFVNGLLAAPLDQGLLAFVTCAVNFGAVCLIFHKFLLNSLRGAFRDFWNYIQAVVLGFVALWVLTKVMDWGFSKLITGYTPVVDNALSALADCSPVLKIIGTVLLVPIIEETLYRGLVFRSLWQKSKVWAYIASIALFALVQTLPLVMGGDWAQLALCFVQHLPAGLCLAWAYTKADNLFAPILVHILMNAITTGIL